MKVSVEFEFEIPANATEEQLFEWVSYQLGATGGCNMKNPLSEHDLEALFGSVYITTLKTN